MAPSDFLFALHSGKTVSPTLLTEMATLFSGHYGQWSSHAPQRAGLPVLHSPSMMRRYIEANGTGVCFLRDEEKLAAQALFLQGATQGHTFTWITQLVVHEKYRHQGLATYLLHQLWNTQKSTACGLMTSNPFSVRALESATGLICHPEKMLQHQTFLQSVAGTIWYVPTPIEIDLGSRSACVNTQFFVDHLSVPEKTRLATRSKPWLLGPLREGWEWLACVFISPS